ncbi:MAG TPA: hypothetical protein VLC91_09360 [Spongiibacteraceae bacterium]|nr:hypothetical protein [Spongiibacteraceae bacterium]
MQLTSIPNAARSGETVVLGIGGIKRNWHGEAPKNLHVAITDAALHTYTLSVNSTFQAYSDYRATLNVMALGGDDGIKLEPYDGAWFIAVPLTDSEGQPLSLAVGAAKIQVTADNLTILTDASGHLFEQEGNLAQLPLEIIAGTPSSLNTSAQFVAYDSRGTHFLIRPTGTSSATIGGAYYVINYQSDSDFGTLKPTVFPVAHNPYINLDYEIKDNGDGSGAYHIYIYDRAGFTTASPRQVKQASLEDLGVHLEYYDAWTDIGQLKANFTLDTTHSYYLDTNGNKITALHPQMLHASDL